MDNSRLNYMIIKWSSDVCGGGCKNWCFNVLTKLREIGLTNQLENPNKNIVKNAVIYYMFGQYKSGWL